MFFVFPGQGSQYPGMGRFLFDNFSSARLTFEEANDALKVDIKKLCFNGPESELMLTENTQPAILITSIATSRVLDSEFGLKPSSVAGHSVGEYSALVAAGVLQFSDALLAVRTRGQAMQSAVPVGQGAMAAVMGLDESQVIALCKYVEEEIGQTPLSPANFNCPGQIVISGKKEAVSWLQTSFKPEMLWKDNPPKRFKLIPLQVSAPFHCALMAPAEEKMRQVLSAMTFAQPLCPVLQNFTATVEMSSEKIRENLIRQVSGPVLWMQSMESAKKLGWQKVIECGAGKVLQGLLKKIDADFFQVHTTQSLDDLKSLEQLRSSL